MSGLCLEFRKTSIYCSSIGYILWKCIFHTLKNIVWTQQNKTAMLHSRLVVVIGLKPPPRVWDTLSSRVWAERCYSDWSEERIFFKSPSVVVFTRSSTAPSRIQVMPTARNITPYLARIHMINIFSYSLIHIISPIRRL